MAIAATIDIVMRANTQDAIDKLWKTTGVLGKMKTAIMGAATAWLSYVSAARLAASVSESFQRLDRLGELSLALDMDPNELYAMSNAAATAGVDIEMLGKSLFLMQRNIGEAFASGKESVFTRLNIDLEQLRKLSPAEQFLQITQALNSVADTTDRASMAQEIFGRGAMNLRAFMSEAETSINAAKEAAERYGGSISKLDISKIGAANDAWDRMRQFINRVIDALAIELAPVVEAVATVAIEWFTKLVHIIDVVASALGSSGGKMIAMVTTVGLLAGAINILVGIIKSLTTAFLALTRAQTIAQALSGPKGWLVLAASIGGAFLALEAIEGEMAKINEQVDQAAKASEAKLKLQDSIVDEVESRIPQIPDMPTAAEVFGLPEKSREEQADRQEDIASKLVMEAKAQTSLQTSILKSTQDGNNVRVQIAKTLQTIQQQAATEANI